MSDYDERITMPWRFSAMMALFLTIVTGGVLEMLLMAGSDLSASPLYAAGLFLLAWGMMTLLVSITMSVTLQIRNRLTWQGAGQPTLRIRGTRKGETSYIPMHLIDSVEPVQFETRWGKSFVAEPPEPEADEPRDETVWWKKFLSIRDANSPIVTATYSQFGYCGSGLRVTYRAPTLTSGGELLTWKHQFPTRQPQTLMSLLNAARK